ncbi:MAG: nitroreductase family protein [Pseudomonadota bacterium]
MFLDLISSRRSIRKYKNKPVEQEKIDALIEAALRSFSSRGFNPWRFIVIDDRDIIQALSKAKAHGSSFLADAPLAVVICGDTAASDVWVEDTAIASAFIHLAAHDMGLGSCWIQIRKREHSASKSSDIYVKEVLKVPDKITIESIIAIGYPDEVKKGHSKETLDSGKVCFNTYRIKE